MERVVEKWLRAMDRRPGWWGRGGDLVIFSTP